MSLESLTHYLEEARDRGDWSQVLRRAWGTADPSDTQKDQPVKAYHRTLCVSSLLRMYRNMVLSRRLDDRELALQKQGRGWFTISGAGKEAVLVAAGEALRPADALWPYYRDRALVLHRGVTAEEMLLQAVASRNDPASAGRQMPAHFGHREKGVVSGCSTVGAHVVGAVGLGEAILKTAKLIGEGEFPADSIVYTSFGDGTSAEGEVYEGMRAAILYRAPVIIHLEDDGFGISVPLEEQVPGEDLMALFRSWPGFRFFDIDGTDVRESYNAFVEAAEHCRARRGPVLIRSKVLRIYSHSSTDDMRKYRPKADVRAELERDPIPRFARELLAYEVAAPGELLDIHREVDREVRSACDRAVAQPKTDSERIMDYIYAYDPPKAREWYASVTAGRKSAHAGNLLTLADAINASLKELFGLLPQTVAWGQDVADLPARLMRTHPELEGKGGVFGLTKGLQRDFGSDRVSNAGICEAAIIGRAVGYAVQGFLPIIEVQFRDYLNPAWQQLMDHAATFSWRSAGKWTCPMVIRMAYGGYLSGAGAIWHSEAAAGALLHYPGIRVCVPSNARDGVALLRGAAFCGEIVCYLEPKALYRRKGEFLDTRYPDFNDILWPGRSRTYGDGRDLAILTYGNTAHMCYDVMKQMERDNVRCRMIDLVWLNPLDEEAIRTAADECGRLLIVDEDRRAGGAGSTIADVVYRDRALRKRVDIERVSALDCRVSYGPVGERAVLPSRESILSAARLLTGRT